MDIPFLIKEREESRILRRNFGWADVSVAEKFSQVLQATGGNQYGSTIEQPDVIELEEAQRQ